MDQPTATIIAAVVAFLGVIGTSIASLIAISIKAEKDREITNLKALQDSQAISIKAEKDREITNLKALQDLQAISIKAEKDREITNLKALQELQVEFDKDLRTQRIDYYKKLWEPMIAFARYPEPDELTYQQLNDIAHSLRKWYFEGGGLVMTEDTRDLYFDMQDGLRILLQKRAGSWSFDSQKTDDTALLNEYLGRPETHKIPQSIIILARTEIPLGDDVPEHIAAHLRALGSNLRTGMTDDVLTRKETLLLSRVQSPSETRTSQEQVEYSKQQSPGHS